MADKKIEEARANRIAGALYDRHNQLLAEKRSNTRKLENELDNMLDMSVSNNQQTVNRIMNLDVDAFIVRIQEIKVAIKLAKEEEAIAQETMTTLFSDMIPTA